MKASELAISESQGPAAFQQSSTDTKKQLNEFLEHWGTSLFTTCLTIYSMVSDDIRQLTCSKETDQIVWIITLIVMGVFTIELTISSFSKPDYFLSFFFWLDVVSTLTMIFDVGWVANQIFPSGKAGGLTNAALVRAARASRIGAKAGRIVRILRIIRLIRILKIYKVAEQPTVQTKIRQNVKKMADSKQTVTSSQQEEPSNDILSGGKIQTARFLQTSGKEKVVSDPSLIVKSSQNSIGNSLASNGEVAPLPGPETKIGMMAKKRLTMFSGNPKTRSKSIFLKNIEAEKLRLFGKPPPSSGSGFNPANPSNYSIDKQSAKLLSEQISNPELAEVEVEDSRSAKVSKNNNLDSLVDLSRQSQIEESAKLDEGDITILMDKALDESQVQEDQKHVQLQTQIAMVEKQILEETNVGRKLSDATTKRIVIIVLILMISLPIFSVDTYAPDYTFFDFGITQMYASLVYHNGLTPEFESIWTNYILDSNGYSSPIISMDIYTTSADGNSTVNFKSYGNSTLVDNFRNDDVNTISQPVEDSKNSTFTIIMNQDLSKYNQQSSILSIVRTIFVCLVLGGASMIFAHEATELVLDPIEKMLEKIKNITHDPLKAAQDEEEQAYYMKSIQQKHKDLFNDETSETTGLLSSIVKIGRLLAIGFGEAGSEIIIKNLNNRGAINPMIPGKKILGIFGFCDIRCFTDATEVLQEKVMVFVNEIAQIVHSRVNQFGGTPNKNIGDAFLLVWKVTGNDADELAHLSGIDFQIGLKSLKQASVASELAIFSFVKIIAEINQSSILSKYNSHEGLKERIPGYKVRMGFGLHLGWAIEGAIGSEYKIDASYLSPHVNMASRLEAATKQFGVSMLVSDVIAEACSPEMLRYMRQIDVVKVKGSDQPIGLFTFDGDFEKLPPSTKKQKRLSLDDRNKMKFVERGIRKAFLDSLMKENTSVASVINRNHGIQIARIKYTRKFYETWEKGFSNYVSGNWKAAEYHMNEAAAIVGGDGPANTLIEFMRQNRFSPPQNWKGFRSLLEK